MLGRLDPSRIPENFYYRNGVDPDGGLLDYARIPGTYLGLDNNYTFAVWRDGRVEYLYQAPAGPDDYKDTFIAQSELESLGIDVAHAPRDSHGVPVPAPYLPAGDVKMSPGGLGDLIGAIAFTVLSFGFGAAVAAPVAVESATAGADVVAGLGAGYEGLAGSGLAISSGGVATEAYLAPYVADTAAIVGEAAQAPAALEVAAGVTEGVDASTGLFAGESATAGTATYGTVGGVATGAGTGAGALEQAAQYAKQALGPAIAKAKDALKNLLSPAHAPSGPTSAAPAPAASSDGVLIPLLLIGALALIAARP